MEGQDVDEAVEQLYDDGETWVDLDLVRAGGTGRLPRSPRLAIRSRWPPGARSGVRVPWLPCARSTRPVSYVSRKAETLPVLGWPRVSKNSRGVKVDDAVGPTREGKRDRSVSGSWNLVDRDDVG